jgi:hypothetical protein
MIILKQKSLLKTNNFRKFVKKKFVKLFDCESFHDYLAMFLTTNFWNGLGFVTGKSHG